MKIRLWLFLPKSYFLVVIAIKLKSLIQHDDKYSGFILGFPVFQLYHIMFVLNNRDLIFFCKSDKYLVRVQFNIGTSILTAIIWILVAAIIIYILIKKQQKKGVRIRKIRYFSYY